MNKETQYAFSGDWARDAGIPIGSYRIRLNNGPEALTAIAERLGIDEEGAALVVENLFAINGVYIIDFTVGVEVLFHELCDDVSINRYDPWTARRTD